MSELRVHNFSISLDGYVAGPGQDLEHPLGVGGEQLHEWVFSDAATKGIRAALDRARAAAGDADVRLGGGAATVRQYIQAGLLDEVHLAVVPRPARERRAAVRGPGAGPRRLGVRRVRPLDLGHPRAAAPK